PIITPDHTMLQAFGLFNATAWRDGRMLTVEELVAEIQEDINERIRLQKQQESQPALPRMPFQSK
ncbi:hypothetical protein ACYT69_11115, partial [Streptococcus pyogenes]